MASGYSEGRPTGRDYSFDEFFDDVGQAGLTPELLLSTWDLRRFTCDASFLVSSASVSCGTGRGADY